MSNKSNSIIEKIVHGKKKFHCKNHIPNCPVLGNLCCYISMNVKHDKSWHLPFQASALKILKIYKILHCDLSFDFKNIYYSHFKHDKYEYKYIFK